ncbi:MAG: CPBP family intramembrane metalloprotease domain-containing protein [Acidobacteria bacterium]|nr:MAG: CPBP family intramembrane metalloprotease domain-containing protein [Acidobacteriota bacterium]
MFLNDEGLRAGWRLLLFIGLALAVLFLLGRLSHLLGVRIAAGLFGPLTAIEGESLLFFSVFAAAAVMAKLERRSLAHYALSLKGAFGRRFWEGAVWGLAALSLLMIAIWLGHGYSFGSVALAGRELLKYAALWAAAFLAVAFFEEFLMRGYALFTLATGIGFWPAALLLSCLFGTLHLGNLGESWVGGLSAGLIGFFFCLTVRRTGSLWFAIGFHAAWDYGESFIYSVPDSGSMVPGHLMESSFRGPAWLTGGSIGPEGSVFVFVLIGLLCLAFDRLNPEVRFPAVTAPASTVDELAAPQ